MNKRIFFVISFAVAFLLLLTTFAQAVDIKFGGQMRPRYNYIDHKGSTGFRSGLAPEQVWLTRVRLGLEIALDEKNSGFIQLQAIGTWGLNAGNRSATSANDSVLDVGLHQAYFTVKDFYDLPVDIQIGRQEVVLDGHRLIGNVGWLQGGRSHDAFRLTHTGDDFTLMYVYSQTTEFDNGGIGVSGFSSTINDPSDELDFATHILWANAKGLIGEKSSTSLYAIYFDAGNGVLNPDLVGPPIVQGAKSHNDIYTAGLRQAGKLLGLDYRAEFYYQFGQAENYNFGLLGLNPLGYANYPVAFTSGAGSGIGRGAYMFGVRVGKKFANVSWKPSVTFWYDHLSGTDQSDIDSNDFSTFATLFATQHKFYGHMDFYQVSGVMGNGFSSKFLGLRDLAVKTSIQPMKKLLVQADFHWFWTDTDLSDPANAPLAATLSCACSANLGRELDITVVHRYNNNLTISAGYSHYFATALFRSTNLFVQSPATGDDADWGFLQFDWKF